MQNRNGSEAAGLGSVPPFPGERGHRTQFIYSNSTVILCHCASLFRRLSRDQLLLSTKEECPSFLSHEPHSHLPAKADDRSRLVTLVPHAATLRRGLPD